MVTSQILMNNNYPGSNIILKVGSIGSMLFIDRRRICLLWIDPFQYYTFYTYFLFELSQRVKCIIDV